MILWNLKIWIANILTISLLTGFEFQNILRLRFTQVLSAQEWQLPVKFFLVNIYWSYELRTFVVEIVVFIYCILFPRMTLCTLPCVFIIIEIANFFSVKLYTLHIRFHSNSSIPCKQKGVWDVVHPIEDSDKTGNTKPQNCRSFKVL